MSNWTFDRILLEPGTALAELQDAEKRRMESNKRINDLLDANNRYLDRAREAERLLAAVPTSQPITAAVLADAFHCFWNAAIGEAHARSSTGAMDTATVMAVGLAAVAARLTENR